MHPVTAQWTISGRVIDASSGEGLSYVNVIIDNSSVGTITGHKGEFQLDGLTAESYSLTFSMIGFQTFHLAQVSSDSDPLVIYMHPEIYLTDEVVVSASRKTQSLSLAPASAAIIHANALEASGTKSFDDAFHGVNGIQVTRSSGSNVQALSIRGASEVAGGGTGNRVLLLLDGRPAISPESGGALWNLVPLGAIDRIEVIKGAYSSLFGSSAMGGIINVITRNADTMPRTTMSVNYGFYEGIPSFEGFGSYRDFYGIDLTHSAKQGKWSYVLNAAKKENDGHREQTFFSSYNAFGKLKFDFSPNRSLQATVMYNDIFNDTPATWLSHTMPYNVAAHRKDDTQHRKEWNLDLHYIAFAHADIKYSTRFFYYSNFAGYSFNDDPENDSTNINKGKQFIDYESVFARRFGNATQVDVSLDEKHYLIGGLELQSDFVDGRPDTVLYGLHHAWNIGAFVQDQITFNEHWTLTAGVRLDHYKITHTFSESNFSPKIAAVYQPTSKVAIRALLARAYRNPSMAERFIKFEQGGGLSFLPNPTLRSEKLDLSAETGIKWNIGKQFKADAAVYYNHYRDLISYEQKSSPGEPLVFMVINLNKVIMQGFEVSMEYMPWDWLVLQSGYTFLDARDQSINRVNTALPYKSRHTGYLSAIVSYEKFNLFVRARGRSRIEEVYIYSGSEPDGYLILNSKLSYSFGNSASAFISVDNITDESYEEIERYRMEGRNFSFGVQIGF